MATKFYLDTRAVKDGEPAPLKLAISRKGTRSFLTLNVSVTKDQWDAKTSKVVKHPSRVSINNYINLRKSTVDMMILRLTSTGEIGGMTAKDIRDLAEWEISGRHEDESTNLDHQFYSSFIEFTDSRNKPKTIEVYRYTLKKINAFNGDAKKILFDDITELWLREFNDYLSETCSVNTRSIHFRNIRAVFNYSIREGYTKTSPFENFDIDSEETAKRSLSVKDLRKLFNYPVKESQQQYLDMFKLSFFLVGINLIDLCGLKEIRDGRIDYNRSKTKKFYSIKVEPEAMAIIEKYKGEKYLINVLDRYKGGYDNYRRRLNKNLQQIGTIEVGKKGKLTYHPEFPDLTYYWARHTWATIAYLMGYSKDLLAQALGHGRKTVTDVYIRYDQRKIDKINRKIIDLVLYSDEDLEDDDFE